MVVVMVVVITLIFTGLNSKEFIHGYLYGEVRGKRNMHVNCESHCMVNHKITENQQDTDWSK